MAEPLANLYSPAFFESFTATLIEEYPMFDQDAFLTAIYDEQWSKRSLKERMRHITLSLKPLLPTDYSQSITLLKAIAPKCRGLEYLFFSDFVEVYGQEDWATSMDAFEHFTVSSSAEFAVRPFIERQPQKMMAQMLQWSESDNEHIRRLASEGCRPRLPWGKTLVAFKEDPSPILPILDRLKDDVAVYVQKSVANNLNDISKDHPELIKKIATDWYGHSKRTDWIIKHGCRGLLRNSHAEVFALFGFVATPAVTIADFQIAHHTLAIGATLPFSFTIVPTSPIKQKLRIEFAIDYMKANGKTSRKLFKISDFTFAGTARTYTRNHSFQNRTTRKHYVGAHQVAIIINGIEFAVLPFSLHTADTLH
ncbi:DNA alkylation repair protein [Kurthia sibirica]|uniref:DNA alkylation repair protein n=1 Tax=Kurthia sibirica TaxID=202750 RepID=A0A2U3AJ30_9BACL|nr:DNA alkylation repair protein [Kurthia sibirica]PWI24546.1 DNA alkylation repair protein [Kurthia sibirica]GEK33615.1 hypothetical protein KSI01_11480 [Kurthia sibirica]